jgi:hypothetical protein
MLDEWETDNLVVPVVERVLFNLVSGQQIYTLGPGGNFNHARPVRMDRASVMSNNNPQQPLELPLKVLDIGQYQRLPVKLVQSALPTKLYWDYAAPLMNLTYWPKPNVGNLQTALYLPTALAQLTGIDIQFYIQPGYYNALSYNLCIRTCGLFERQIPSDLPKLADDAIGNIRRANIHPEIIAVDAAIISSPGKYNWLNDEGG